MTMMNNATHIHSLYITSRETLLSGRSQPHIIGFGAAHQWETSVEPINRGTEKKDHAQT